MTEKPPLVEPNSDKLDLPRFYQDLPKYYQYLSEESHQNWEQFRSQNPETICSEGLQWEMPKLLSAAILSSQSPVETANVISASTISLIQKETTAPKPVCLIFYVIDQLFDKQNTTLNDLLLNKTVRLCPYVGQKSPMCTCIIQNILVKIQCIVGQTCLNV